MTWNGLLKTLNPPVDGDYVGHFQALADINLEIKRDGPSAPRLVRRSLLEAALGNYRASYRSADDARFLAPDDPEALYQFGVASLLLCYAEVGALECARDGMLVDRPLPELLRAAREALRACVKGNPSDGDARAIMEQVEDLLRRRRSDTSLRRALSAHRSWDPGRPPRPRG